MRNFGTLGNSQTRAIAAQTSLRWFPSPTYLQSDIKPPYGTPAMPPQPTNAYYEHYTAPETNKYDMWTSAIDAVGQIGSQITEGQYMLKGAQISGAQNPYATGGSSAPSNSSGTVMLVLGLAGLAGVGLLAYMVTR